MKFEKDTRGIERYIALHVIVERPPLKRRVLNLRGFEIG